MNGTQVIMIWRELVMDYFKVFMYRNCGNRQKGQPGNKPVFKNSNS
jgi:hypothetical protein